MNLIEVEYGLLEVERAEGMTVTDMCDKDIKACDFHDLDNSQKLVASWRTLTYHEI